MIFILSKKFFVFELYNLLYFRLPLFFSLSPGALWYGCMDEKRGLLLSEILPDKRIQLKNQNLLIWKYILRESAAIKPGSCFGDIRISLRIARMLFVKCRCNIFKNCRKTVSFLVFRGL